MAEIVNEIIDEDIQTTFNEDSLDDLVEEGELENVYNSQE
jgi:hypothetical protein